MKPLNTLLIVATLVTILITISGATAAMDTSTVEAFTMQAKFDGNQIEELTSLLQWCNPDFEYSFLSIGHTTTVVRTPLAPWINIDSTKVLTETDIQIKGTSNLGPNTKIMFAGYSDVDHEVYPLGDASKNADGTWSGEAHPASCSVIRAEYITVYVFALSCSDELWPLKVPMTESELLDFLETNSCCHEVVKVHRPCTESTLAPWINIDSTKVLTETDIQIKGTSNLGPNTKIMLAGYSDVDHEVYPLGDASKNADGTWSGEAHPASCSVIRAEYITVYVFALSCSDELWPLKVPMTESELLDFLETNSCCHEVVKVHRPCGCCGRIEI